MIKIIDYQMGNLRSVQKALEHLGFEAEICTQPEQLSGADHLILPGVGAFRDAIAALKKFDLIDPIHDHLKTGRPMLGICLGLQLLLSKSYEDGEYEGLNLIPGNVVRFEAQPGLKIPHMGWNQLVERQQTPLLEEIPESAHFYFVHSYHAQAEDPQSIAAKTDYGSPVVAVLQKDNLYATQFHPEKSQQYGLQLLKNFITKC